MYKNFLQKIRDGEQVISRAEMAAIVMAVIALAASAGVARWSWLILDEQVKLRNEFMALKNAQEQLNVQFEFWNEQLQKERAELDR